jgi:arylsulfatase A-like enzyme
VPTILELMGIPGDSELRGQSLLPDTATPNHRPEERDIYIDMPEGPFNEMRRAIISGPSPGTKLIDFGGGRYELFDLSADPNEAKSLAMDPGLLRAAKESMARTRAGLREVAPSR